MESESYATRSSRRSRAAILPVFIYLMAHGYWTTQVHQYSIAYHNLDNDFISGVPPVFNILIASRISRSRCRAAAIRLQRSVPPTDCPWTLSGAKFPLTMTVLLRIETQLSRLRISRLWSRIHTSLMVKSYIASSLNGLKPNRLKLATGSVGWKRALKRCRGGWGSPSPAFYQSRLCQLATRNPHQPRLNAIIQHHLDVGSNSGWDILLLIWMYWKGFISITADHLRILRELRLHSTNSWIFRRSVVSEYFSCCARITHCQEKYTCLFQASLRTEVISITYSSISVLFGLANQNLSHCRKLVACLLELV